MKPVKTRLNPINVFFIFNISCLLALCISFKASAQLPDYFINLKNDTVRCKLKEDYFTKALSYKLTENSAYKPLSYDTINEYYLHLLRKPNIRQLVTPDKVYFLKLDLKGKINLYEMDFEKRHKLEATYYVSKDGGLLKQIGSDDDIPSEEEFRQQKQAFYGLIADVPPYLELFKGAEDFSIDAIKACIKQYNAYQARKIKSSN